MRVPLLLLVTSALLWSGTNPDFSGDWKLDLAKSDFGKSPAPVAMTSHIQHHDPELTVESKITRAEDTYTTKYRWFTDGREVSNTIRGNEIRTTVMWNAGALISNAKTKVDGVTLNVVDRWQLSEDGDWLTVSRTIVAPQGNAEQTFVYGKP
jgi:hypothetical protein